MVIDGGKYDTRAGWQFYVVGVATSILPGTFKMKTWITKAKGKETPTVVEVPEEEDLVQEEVVIKEKEEQPDITDSPCVKDPSLPGCISEGNDGLNSAEE